MWTRIRAFFDKVFRIGKAVADVTEAAQSIQDIGKGGDAPQVVGAVAKAAGNVGNASGSVGEATK